MQSIITTRDSAKEIRQILVSCRINRCMLVCGSSFDSLKLSRELADDSGIRVRFSGFAPNPKYEDILNGVKRFRQADCDGILAIGGGSAMDTAKCIKLFSQMSKGVDCLTQQYEDTGIPLIAVPTTAGTGSESTRFAVIYKDGVKQSVAHESIIPNYAVLDATLLSGLPVYQKKCAMLDALCQGIESFWSVNSTSESRDYSKAAISGLLEAMEGYVYQNDITAGERVLEASNLAGRAINITQTTAPHAMSYKLTSLYGIPHGHAVALCLPKVWRHMLINIQDCTDERGAEYLQGIFRQISDAMRASEPIGAVCKFERMLKSLDITPPQQMCEEDIYILTGSINTTRIRNNPVKLDAMTIYRIYEQIMKEGQAYAS